MTAREWKAKLDDAPDLRDALAKFTTLELAGNGWLNPYVAVFFTALERRIIDITTPNYVTDKWLYVRGALTGMPAIDLRFGGASGFEDWVSPPTRDLFAAIERYVASATAKPATVAA